MKKRVTPLMCLYAYTGESPGQYTYIYPYNHTNMFLGCPGRGPGPWEPLGDPRGLRNTENLEVFTYPHIAIYLRGTRLKCRLRLQLDSKFLNIWWQSHALNRSMQSIAVLRQV